MDFNGVFEIPRKVDLDTHTLLRAGIEKMVRFETKHLANNLSKGLNERPARQGYTRELNPDRHP